MAVTLTTPNTILGVLEPKSQTTRLISNVFTVLLGTVVVSFLVANTPGIIVK